MGPCSTHTHTQAHIQVLASGPLARAEDDEHAALHVVPAVLSCLREWTDRLEVAAELAVADAESEERVRQALSGGG